MSEDIDMKIGPVAKLEKNKTKERQKKFDDYVMPTICDVIFTFLIYGQFGEIQMTDSGPQSVKFTYFLTVTFYLTKTANKTKNL